jgi:hypothetical protein
MTVYIAAALFASLGVGHLILIFSDMLGRPRYFRPTDDSAFEAMGKTRTAISALSRPYWSGIIGFHISHSMGVLWFGGMIALSEHHRLFTLRPYILATAAIYTLLAWRCWFWGPLTGIAVATGMLCWAWLL